MVERVRARHVVAEHLQAGAAGQLVEGDLVGDAPVADREPVVGMPQHRLADRVVEREHGFLPLDHRRVRTPGDPVDGLVDHHVRRDDALVLARALEMHVAPEVEQDRAAERLDRLLEQLGGRDHAVADGLFEPVHGVSCRLIAAGALFS